MYNLDLSNPFDLGDIFGTTIDKSENKILCDVYYLKDDL